MKKTITVFAFAAIFTACNNNPKTGSDTAKVPVISDTSAAIDSSLTDRGEVINMSGVSDTIVTEKGQYVKVQPQTVATSEKTEKKVVTTTKPVRHRSRPSTVTSTSNETVSSGTDASTQTETTTTVQKKKGWSNAAKGAAIGAGTGAVAGAIISKKKGTGAIIGGLLGAGGGYVIGKSKDKKEQKKQQ